MDTKKPQAIQKFFLIEVHDDTEEAYEKLRRFPRLPGFVQLLRIGGVISLPSTSATEYRVLVLHRSAELKLK
jgi:hypothetical protein